MMMMATTTVTLYGRDKGGQYIHWTILFICLLHSYIAVMDNGQRAVEDSLTMAEWTNAMFSMTYLFTTDGKDFP